MLAGRRRSSGHGAKAGLLGSPAKGKVSPAWRTPATATSGPQPLGVASSSKQGAGVQLGGSKILISSLPFDVTQKEAEDLFSKTIGPLKDAFVIYNSQGNSKGMAIIHFQRPGDAATARQKYHGKLVDGKKPLRIEVITDGVPTFAQAPAAPSAPPSLLSRMGITKPNKANAAAKMNGAAAPAAPRQKAVPLVAQAKGPRKKKGAKRVKKVAFEKKSAEQLDKEMEDYKKMEVS